MAMSLSDTERDQNKRVDWQTRQTAAGFEVFNPATGTVAKKCTTLCEAGHAVSDLKTYGHVQER